MAVGYPINRYKTMSKPIFEQMENQVKTQDLLMNKDKKTELKKRCDVCDEYKEMIEFQKNIIYIILGGVIIKYILDSLLKDYK